MRASTRTTSLGLALQWPVACSTRSNLAAVSICFSHELDRTVNNTCSEPLFASGNCQVLNIIRPIRTSILIPAARSPTNS
jgi:hypothetical protein